MRNLGLRANAVAAYSMKIVNFSHPLTPPQMAQLRDQFGLDVSEADIISRPARFDNALPFAPQVVALVDSLDIAPDEWQTSPPLVVPPALGPIASLLMAEIEGRCGTFPALIRICPVESALVPAFEVAEVINLLRVRAKARERRVA